MESWIDLGLLLVGFIFSFFVCGYVVVEILTPNLGRLAKLPVYIILSVLISTLSVYVASVFWGFSRMTILVTFVPFAIGFWALIWRRGIAKFLPKKHGIALAGGVLIYGLLATSLYPAIFHRYQNYFVMGANNWQDTPMHLSIIESLAQGNFPPEAPYFAGEPLTYYFLADFQAAILVKLYGDFLPQILVWVNPIFAATFYWGVYALGYYLFKKRSVAGVGALMATFFGNQMYTRFLADVGKGGSPLALLERDGYALDFNGIFQVTPMIDYFMQNRPMMVGLPVFVVVALLTYLGVGKKRLGLVFLAGLTTGMALKFQLFAFGAALVAFGMGWIIFWRKKNYKFFLKAGIIFLLPAFYFVALGLLFFPGGGRILALFGETFRWGVWEKMTLGWHLLFLLANFGGALILVILGLVYL